MVALVIFFHPEKPVLHTVHLRAYWQNRYLYSFEYFAYHHGSLISRIRVEYQAMDL